MEKITDEPGGQPLPPYSIKFQVPEPPAGAYWIGGVHEGVAFTLKRKPAWLARFMMRWVFGWVWVDAKAK